MYSELTNLEKLGIPIHLAIVGCGHQGRGLANQTRLTPGLKLTAAVDLDIRRAVEAVRVSGNPDAFASKNYFSVLEMTKFDLFDLMVEASTSISSGARHCIATLEKGIPVVLMNAELDLLLRPYLEKIAKDNNTIISSDSGDQPGVIANLIDEVQVLGLKPVLLGNIKGFLNRYATYPEIIPEAKKRHIDTQQCVAMTDGTKVNIEMAILANAFNAQPLVRGMVGPRCNDIHESLKIFAFNHFSRPMVEYILGARPGGGVFVIACSDDPLQQQYLGYYKMGKGPYYLFYRPYHLCHFETPRVITKVFLYKKSYLKPLGKFCEVFAFCKKDLPKGFPIKSAIGSDEFYGMIDTYDRAKDLIPISLLEAEERERPIIKYNLKKDDPLTWDTVDFPDTYLLKLYQKQEKFLKEDRSLNQGNKND